MPRKLGGAPSSEDQQRPATVRRQRQDEPDPVLERRVPELAVEHIGWLIASLAVRLTRSATRFYGSHWGIGATEYRLILALGRDGGGTSARTAAAADVDKAAASRSLQLLRDAGFVELVRPGRDMQVSLTVSGKALCASLGKASRMRERRLTRGMSTADVARLRADLQRLIDNLAFMNS
jgi:DNA-binding MarR family transcriptional regulator